MECEKVALPGGDSAIICSRGRRRSTKCRVCKERESTLECDGPNRNRKSGTCDKALCEDARCRTATTLAGKPVDLCPPCVERVKKERPACRRCGPGYCMPLRLSEGRFYGPEDGSKPNVFCPACGHGWAGSEIEVEGAEVAERAYQRKLRSEERADEKKKAGERAAEKRAEMQRKIALASQGRWK